MPAKEHNTVSKAHKYSPSSRQAPVAESSDEHHVSSTVLFHQHELYAAGLLLDGVHGLPHHGLLGVCQLRAGSKGVGHDPVRPPQAGVLQDHLQAPLGENLVLEDDVSFKECVLGSGKKEGDGEEGL